MVKKILFTFLILPMLFSNMCYGKEEAEKQDTPGHAIFVMAIPKEIEIEEQQIEKSTKDLVMNAKIPRIKGLTDKKFERKINKHLKTRVTDLQKQVQDGKEENAKNNKILPYEVISSYKVKESKEDLLNIGFFDYVYRGGSHGFLYQSYVVIDLSENQILTLESLFDEKVNYRETIENLIHKQIVERTDKGQIFYDELAYSLSMNEDERFYINPNGDLVIVFNVYEIAPYASGVTEFLLPKEQLKGYRFNK